MAMAMRDDEKQPYIDVVELDDDELNADWLRTVLCRSEGQYLDFKRGTDWDKKKRNKALLEHILGFANSDGGLIVWGVADEKRNGTRELTGIADMGQTHRNILAQIAPLLVPLPTVRMLTVGELEVMLVAVHRSNRIVPDSRGTVFYRVGDGTEPYNREMPVWLQADIFHGRRANPHFEVELQDVIGHGDEMHLRLSICNVTPVWPARCMLFAVAAGLGQGTELSVSLCRLVGLQEGHFRNAGLNMGGTQSFDGLPLLRQAVLLKFRFRLLRHRLQVKEEWSKPILPSGTVVLVLAAEGSEPQTVEVDLPSGTVRSSHRPTVIPLGYPKS